MELLGAGFEHRKFEHLTLCDAIYWEIEFLLVLKIDVNYQENGLGGAEFTTLTLCDCNLTQRDL